MKADSRSASAGALRGAEQEAAGLVQAGSWLGLRAAPAAAAAFIPKGSEARPPACLLGPPALQQPHPRSRTPPTPQKPQQTTAHHWPPRSVQHTTLLLYSVPRVLLAPWT